MPLSKLNNDSFAGTAVHGRRNLIINGAMQVAQRGTSFDQSDEYTLDRFRINASGETLTVSQQSFTAGQTDIPRAEKYLRLIVTTTGNNAGITHRIEGVEQLSGQTVTLSFYARGGQGGQAVPTTFRTYFNQNFGSGGSSSVNVQGQTNHSLTSSWQRFTATATLGSTSGKTIGAGAYTEIFFQQTTGEACDFDLTLCQLEVGDKATPFEHRSLAEEERLCFRYYYDSRFGSNDGGAYSPHRDAQYGHVRACIAEFPVKMRAAPTVSIQSTNANSMDRFGRGQEQCFPKADNVHADHFQNIVKYTSSAQTTTANWTDSGNYINRAGYKANAEL